VAEPTDPAHRLFAGAIVDVATEHGRALRRELDGYRTPETRADPRDDGRTACQFPRR
jgi:hypothetical protein